MSTDQGLISTIHNECLQINRELSVSLSGQELNRYFTKEDIQMANTTWGSAQHYFLSEKCMLTIVSKISKTLFQYFGENVKQVELLYI